MGIVEDANGSIMAVFPYEIRFTDEIFEEYVHEDCDSNDR